MTKTQQHCDFCGADIGAPVAHTEGSQAPYVFDENGDVLLKAYTQKDPHTRNLKTVACASCQAQQLRYGDDYDEIAVQLDGKRLRHFDFVARKRASEAELRTIVNGLPWLHTDSIPKPFRLVVVPEKLVNIVTQPADNPCNVLRRRYGNVLGAFYGPAQTDSYFKTLTEAKATEILNDLDPQ